MPAQISEKAPTFALPQAPGEMVSPPVDAEPAAATAEGGVEAEQQRESWTAVGWVSALQALDPVVAKALVGAGAPAKGELATLCALGETASKKSLSKRLADGSKAAPASESLLRRSYKRVTLPVDRLQAF